MYFFIHIQYIHIIFLIFQTGSMDRLCSCVIVACYGIISILDVLIKLLYNIFNTCHKKKK